MFHRCLELPKAGTETFFLWGPRQTGKTTLLASVYPKSLHLDLLAAETFRRYLQRPEALAEEIAAHRPQQVVIDEVQKLPALLDEVHRLHERGVRFALCGSSARKVRRGHANLLGGRALRYALLGLVSAELAEIFDLDRVLNVGYLPRIVQAANADGLLRAYVADYLKEEIVAEGLVRNLPVFDHFLSVAALSDTEPVNFSTVGRDCGVSHHTAGAYFQILVDTLVGRWLPAYRRRPKRRTVAAAKFFFADVGVVNTLAKRHNLTAGSAAYGKAFENWLCHELSAYLAYRRPQSSLTYWRLSTGVEVDFVVDDMRIAIEAKASKNVTADHLRGLRQLQVEHPEVGRRIVVCLEGRARQLGDGISVIPALDFVRALWRDELL